MAFWDFVKDSGKSVLGEAKAAEAPADDKAAEKAETDRKVKALTAEVKALGLDSDDVHLTLKGDVVKVESKGADRETMEKLILAVGNIKGIARVEADVPKAPGRASSSGSAAPASEEPVFHTVKSGETLSAIAKQYLGDANRYNDIFKANQPILSDPDKIYPGQSLRIPQ
ncbi:MAG: peptidoglycan-binding protein LysM [Paracoccus denitrificans]|uniref:Potassium binding protein Kbp n=1 Tax=Paracoccus denitrificans TaxID=266 RepID=A0A533I6I0_PARDE|nr:MAG: peptidoglycan-binding protein LysM [Paracoccus denitrificans]